MNTTMRQFGLGVAALGALGLLGSAPALARQMMDGRILFDSPPELVEATTRDHFEGLPAEYHFTVAVPVNAGEALEAVKITPRDHARSVVFNLDRSEASLGDAYAQGASLPLASIGGADDGTDSVLVVFDQPVQPGERATVSLDVVHNPRAGVYLYGVTAYPAGEGGVGQFLGYGRLHVYDSGS